jgi:hypothetical protein
MVRSHRRVLCGFLIAGGMLAGTAVAATPESGEVSKAAPKVTWAGQTTGSYFTRVPAAVTADDSVPCEAPSCDTFALKVADSATLTVAADIVQPADNPGAVTIRIRKPDGSVVVGSSDADAVSEGKPFKMTIKSAPTGDYTVEYWNNFYDGPIDYTASAELAVPPPAVAPPTVAAPPPGPAPVEAIGLAVSVPKVSARSLARSRKLAAKVTVSRAVTAVTATLKKGAKKVGAGRLGATSGTAKLTVKTAKKLKPGTYSLVVNATDGKTATAKTVKVTVKK